MTDAAEIIQRFLAAERQAQARFLAELVAVPSDNPPGDCAPHAERAAALLEELGFAVELAWCTDRRLVLRSWVA
jgi:succinyl-diaminopimelate desuccinylase